MDLHVVLNYCKGSQSLAKNRNTHESSGQAAPNAYTTFTGLADLARSLYMKYMYIYIQTELCMIWLTPVTEFIPKFLLLRPLILQSYTLDPKL